MKKLIVFILVMMLAVPVFATSYEIMTDKGKQEVVVPDGYDPLDVLLIIAQNYYNLNYKYEEIVIDYEKLTDKANSYIEANNQLRANYCALESKFENLSKAFENLSKEYSKATKIDLIKSQVGFQLGYNPFVQKLNIGMTYGAVLMEKVNLLSSIVAELGDPPSMSVSLGLLFLI